MCACTAHWRVWAHVAACTNHPFRAKEQECGLRPAETMDAEKPRPFGEQSTLCPPKPQKADGKKQAAL